MKRLLVVVPLTVIWLFSCVTMSQKKSGGIDFVTVWSNVLLRLNEEPQTQSFLTDDLIAHYDSEIGALQTLWQKQPRTFTDAKAERKTMHEFFHGSIATRNKQELLKAVRVGTTTKDYWALATRIIRQVENHQTAASKHVANYKEGYQIGFCFGRALLVHYLLIQAGVPQDTISKAFVVGDLVFGSQFWRYHVAMMIASSDGPIIVDPLYGEPALLADWFTNVASLDVKMPLSRARLYVTDPRKFMASSGMYAMAEMQAPELKTYFNDLGRSLSDGSAP